MSIQIEVASGEVLTFPVDILALKYAQHSFGVDAIVVQHLAENGIDIRGRLPGIGTSMLVESQRTIAAPEVLFIGVEPLGRFDYQSIRRFSQSVLSTIARDRPLAKQVAITLHGTGFGLDEAEAFRAEIAGVLDAIATRSVPAMLQRIVVIERNARVASRLRALLNVMLPSGIIKDAQTETKSLQDARSDLSAVGHGSRHKPHVFVAMPFAEEYADRFHYGIVGAANAAGFLCERADLASFTGDVLAWVKERIGSSSLVIADLSAANPNVYLEVGYAWGRGIDTVLIVAEGDELKFDVRTQRCLIFRNIRHLEELLTAELKALAAAGKTMYARPEG